MTSLSLVSSETAVPHDRDGRTAEPAAVLSASSRISKSLFIIFALIPPLLVRTGDMFVLASPPRFLLRSENDRDRGQLENNTPVIVRSKSVRFAGRNGRATPSSADSICRPWDSGESPPPAPGSSYKRVLFQLPPFPNQRRLRFSRVALSLSGSRRSPPDYPVVRAISMSLRTETISSSLQLSASEHRSFGDFRRPIRPI